MTYNPQQLKAINSNERTILCLAGAGAGKTKTLLGRIERLIRDGADPTSILALTFTNAAAAEMRNRYKLIKGLDISKGVPEFKTFHGFCYSIIVKDPDVRAKLGYTKIPQVCDDNELKRIRTKIKLQLGCKLSDDQLENDVYLSKSEQEEKKIFQKALAKELRKENLITFDIMCYNVGELFERKDNCIEQYRQKYHYIFLDEFQDTDRRQFRFVSSFPETTNFWLCADALQCIYQFRNCTNEFVKKLAVTPGWEVIKLYKNYRSTRQICEFANKFSKYAKDEYRIAMEGQRDGDNVEVIYGSAADYSHPVDENHLEILIDKLKENKGECAILCRTNKECAAVRSALTNAKIEFSSQAKTSDSIDILKCSLSNDYMLDWLSAKLDAKDYGDYIRLSQAEENPDIRWFLNTYSNNYMIRHYAEKVIEIRNIAASSQAPKAKFEQIAKVVRAKTKCVFKGDASTSNREIVESIQEQLEKLAEVQIYCGTIHSSKGLEYDTVYVMGVNDTMFQLGTEEMNNLAYVAYTRAKNHLVVFRQ